MANTELKNIFFHPLSDENLAAYLERIAYGGNVLPTLQVLDDLHKAHVTAICFENIHPFLKLPLSVAMDDIFNKLVLGKMGGYCFEHNLLFAAVLLKIGFQLDMLTARVDFNTPPLPPRTHMLLRVHADNCAWLVDVGFGARGIVVPLLMEPAPSPRQCAGRTFRIQHRGALRVLQTLVGPTWADLYAFTLEPQEWVDYKMANHYVSTHPDSKFTQMLTLQIHTETSQIILKGKEIVETRGSTLMNKAVVEKKSMEDLLRKTFNLHPTPKIIHLLQNTIFRP